MSSFRAMAGGGNANPRGRMQRVAVSEVKVTETVKEDEVRSRKLQSGDRGKRCRS